MLPNQRWATSQKATPSFMTQEVDSSSILQQPMPADLQRFASPQAASPSPVRRTPGKTRPSSAGATVNRSAATTTRGSTTSNIHEDLIERGRLYEQRQEALREKAIQDELKKCRQVPRISKMGQQIERGEKIVPRLFKIAAHKERMMAYKHQEIDIHDKKAMQDYFKPKLSRKGCRSQGKTMKTQHDLWNTRKEEKMEALKAERIAAQLEDVHDAPDINPRSEQLANRRREKEGMAGYTHYEAMIERDRLSKLAKWEQRERQFAVENPGTPRITHYAATMDRENDVSERLHQSAILREERRIELEKRYAAEKLSKSGGKRVDEHEASDFLHRHEDYQRRRDARLTEIREMERRAHTPKINPVSEAIAAAHPQSTLERLSTPRRRGGPISHVASPAATTPTPSASPASASAARYEYPGAKNASSSAHTSVSPIPMDRSDNSASRKVDPQSLKTYERMMMAESRRQERLSRVREEMERKEVEDCTFAPETTTRDHLTPGSTYERTMQWAKRRDEKLAQERTNMRQNEVDYKFAPNVSHPDGYDMHSEPAPAGFDSFVHRQQQARERQNPAPSPGQWTPHRTVPEEFHLGSGGPSHIASLEKPIAAPVHHKPAAAGSGPSSGVGAATSQSGALGFSSPAAASGYEVPEADSGVAATLASNIIDSARAYQ